jgi:hypothetical protein
MKFEDLIEFVEKHKLMSHIYLPMGVRALLESGVSATRRKLA